MSRSSTAPAADQSGCAWFVVTFVMPLLSFIVAAGALFNGAMLTISCERIEPRIAEEVLETRGVITSPVERIVQEGRVEAHITRKILGLLPVSRVHLVDVIDVDSTSSTSRVTDASGRTTSTYTSGQLDLTTRDGRKWSSPEISHSLGHAAGEMEERIEQLLRANDHQRISVWSIGWLANIIGVGFTLASLMFTARWLAKLFRGHQTLATQ